MRGSALGSVALGLTIFAASTSPRAATPQIPSAFTTVRLRADTTYEMVRTKAAYAGASLQRAASSPSSASPQEAALREFCFTCHNQRLKTGGLALDVLDAANVSADAETVGKHLRALEGMESAREVYRAVSSAAVEIARRVGTDPRKLAAVGALLRPTAKH